MKFESRARPWMSTRAARNLEQLVTEFERQIVAPGSQELRYFAEMPSLELAIHYAGLATDWRGKRFHHQCRIPRPVLVRATHAMMQAKHRISSCTTFKELLSLLIDLVDHQRGVGELYHYDTSLRIGAYLGLSPEAVYLHAGARQGAKALGLDAHEGRVRVQDLPKPLQVLRPDDIEDFLCICKKQLASLNSPARAAASNCRPRTEPIPARRGC
jgi:hypothetical protein